MRTELSKFSSLLKSFPHERFLLETQGFNKIGGGGGVGGGGVVFTPSCLQPAHWAEQEKREEMSCVWRQDSGRIKSDCLLCVFLLTPHRIILTGGTVLSDTFNESLQINPDNYSKSKEHLIKPGRPFIHQTAATNGNSVTVHTHTTSSPAGIVLKNAARGRFGWVAACFLWQMNCFLCLFFFYDFDKYSSCWCPCPAAVQCVAELSCEGYWWAVGSEDAQITQQSGLIMAPVARWSARA